MERIGLLELFAKLCININYFIIFTILVIVIMLSLYMGAGILPVSIVNNKLHFLFGKESVYDDSPGYSDFGGGTDPGETPIQTAIREGGEELHGFIGNKQQLRAHLRKNKYYLCQFERYSVFMVLIDYDPNLPIYYNNHYDFLFKHLPDNLVHDIIFDQHVFEKQHVKWFSEKELKTKSRLFRGFYRPFLKNYLGKRNDILRFFTKDKKYDFTKNSNKRNKTRKNRKGSKKGSSKRGRNKTSKNK